MNELDSLLACPRCDKAPLDRRDDAVRCAACKVDFPLIDGMPWLFAEPQAALGDWRGRLHFSLQQLAAEHAAIGRELEDASLTPLARRRTERYGKCIDSHRRKLKKLLRPLEVDGLEGSVESYLALRTRLPSDQGLHTYYANVHRDWAWGDEENAAALAQVRAVLHEHAELGRVLVLGAGAGRLAYDLHTNFDCATTVGIDFNPLLLLVARTVSSGKPLRLYEFPIAPIALEDDAVLRTLEAPAPAGDDFHLVIGDALRAPFVAGSFDTVVTPWLIDVIAEGLPRLARRINQLLRDDGRWVNFGSHAFAAAERSRRYSPEESRAIVCENGFSDPYVAEATIPYMCSPASRHGRRERVFSFCAYRNRAVDKPPRHTALPEWLVTGKEPVPLSASFRQQAMTTRIYAFMMSLIDGKRSIREMAAVFEKQKLMSREEAEPAIRSFLTKMYDDEQAARPF